MLADIEVKHDGFITKCSVCMGNGHLQKINNTGQCGSCGGSGLDIAPCHYCSDEKIMECAESINECFNFRQYADHGTDTKIAQHISFWNPEQPITNMQLRCRHCNHLFKNISEYKMFYQNQKPCPACEKYMNSKSRRVA